MWTSTPRMVMLPTEITILYARVCERNTTSNHWLARFATTVRHNWPRSGVLSNPSSDVLLGMITKQPAIGLCCWRRTHEGQTFNDGSRIRHPCSSAPLYHKRERKKKKTFPRLTHVPHVCVDESCGGLRSKNHKYQTAKE